MFYLMMLSTHFIYGYMASDIWFKYYSDYGRERKEMFYLMMWIINMDMN